MESTAVNSEVVLLLREIKELLQKQDKTSRLSQSSPDLIDRQPTADDSNGNTSREGSEKVFGDRNNEDALVEGAETLSLELEGEGGMTASTSSEASSLLRLQEEDQSPWLTHGPRIFNIGPPPDRLGWRFGATTFFWAPDTYHISPRFQMQELMKQSSDISVKKAEDFEWCSGAEWSYWRLTVPDSNLPPEFALNTNMTYLMVSRGKGLSNYVPEWELWRVDGELHHIDGEILTVKSKPSLNFQHEDQSSGHPLAWGDNPDEEDRLIPYSLTPSWRFDYRCREPTALGLANHPAQLQQFLGSLYSVPPDWRIHLTFEKDVLRSTAQGGESAFDVSQILRLWSVLHKYGTFQIVDIDDFGNAACYQLRVPLVRDRNWTLKEDPRVLAKHALEAEQNIVKIPPVICRLKDEGPDRPKRVIKQSNVRWYRIISFRGLSAAVTDDTSSLYRHLLSVNDFCKLLFREIQDVKSPRTTPEYVGVPLSEIVQAVELHIRCKSRTEGANPFVENWEPFHISWFKIVSAEQLQNLEGSWKHGPLYGSTRAGPGQMYLQEVAYTMGLWLSGVGYSGPVMRSDFANTIEQYMWSGDESRWYWAILELAPAYFPEICHGHPNGSRVFSNGGHMIPLELILQTLVEATNSWDEIVDYLTRLINKRDAIFNPQEHDGLLFDDSTFSRSRLYFWSIDCLDLFIPSVGATVREWEQFWEVRQELFEAGERVVRRVRAELDHVEQIREPMWDNVLPKIDNQIGRLRTIQARLEILREQVTTLRDGLFNASAGIESRAATELGQNVKLLTYVSIAYLPLSFCATLWSIDFSYHPVIFTLVMVLLSATTYVIVINLNNVVRLGKSVYRQFRAGIVHSMVKDPRWAAVGESFSQFRPERESATPSEWNILGFLLSRVWVWIRGLVVRIRVRGSVKPANV